MSRSIRQQYSATRDDIGDLVTRRPLPNAHTEQIDPFLFLNHHGPQLYPPGNRGLPFGPHPHRGFETVTFIVEGSLAHRDTGGHESVIEKGGVQWMTAGRGLEHSELSPKEFLDHGGPLEILQLWINLPSRLKMTQPRYVGLQRSQIPAATSDGGAVVTQVIAGELCGVSGPIESLTGHVMATIELGQGGTIDLPAPVTRNVFLYIVRGELRIGREIARAHHLVDFANDGDVIAIEAMVDTLILYGHADPIGEPVVAYGPFVMNSREEILEAIRDYEAGTFR